MLRDQNGKLFKLSSLRGKAVYLTFVYSHCPDVCPLMMQALGAAKRWLKDPGEHARSWPSRSTPRATRRRPSRSSCAARLLTGKVRWLLGTRAQLAPVWSAYNILAKSVPQTPAIIEHVSLDLRHRREGPHPRRVSGLAAQGRPGSRTTRPSSPRDVTAQ